MLTKEQVLESIKNMPEDRFDHIDILLERLVMLDKIYTGIEQCDKGESISTDELEKQIGSWEN